MKHEDPIPYLFLCNGAKLTSRKKVWKGARATPLSTDRKSGNIEIRISEIYEALASNLHPLAADLLEIAASIYVADQLGKRTGRKTVDYGDLWYRNIRLECAVREPDFWRQSQVSSTLTRMLHFIAGDNYEIGFSKNSSPANIGDYLDFRKTAPNPEGIEHVTLFSGGLDSLAGAVDQVFNEEKRIALVSHKPAGHVAGLQKQLVRGLTERAIASGVPPMPISVWAHKRGIAEKDHTQRTRSFLYVALGAVVARMLDLNSVDFFENGIVSVNLPLARHEFGGRATRTTHPQTLAWFEKLLSEVFEAPFKVNNDYLWHTKQDVVQVIDRAGQGDLIAQAVSCMHTRQTTQASPHCGTCSQCLSRRFATLGVRDGHDDPADLYRVDVMTGARTKTEDRTIAERFLGLVRKIDSMDEAEHFFREFAADLGRVTPFVGNTTSIAVDRLFDLHKRHAEQTSGVIQSAMELHVGDLYRGNLPDSCPVMLAFQQAASVPKTVDTDEPAKILPASVNNDIDFVPSKSQWVVLEILEDATKLQFQQDIVSASRQRGHPLSRKTVGLYLRDLREQGLVAYPQGDRKGVCLSDPGRELLQQRTAH